MSTEYRFDQPGYTVRCEWGLRGVETLGTVCDALVIVDVLSFTTAVSLATDQGAIVFPFARRDESALAFAQSQNALLADGRASQYSLSLASIRTIPARTRIVLPSPNGSTLSLATGSVPTFAGCLRNATAVASAVAKTGTTIGVIPAGERWRDDGSLRPSLEDWIGAGAIIHALDGSKSPEAALAETAFLSCRDHLLQELSDCVSGQELIAKGLKESVELAAMYGSSSNAPRLLDGSYQIV